jgi:hypothetical protein
VDPVENTQRFGDAQIMTKLSVSDKPETHLFHVFPTSFLWFGCHFNKTKSGETLG